MLAVGNDAIWRRFAPVAGLEDLLEDPRFTTNPLRVEHRDTLLPLVADAMASRTSAEWLEVLDAAGVPVGPIQTVDEVVRDPQVLARGMIGEVAHPTAGTVRTVGCPVRLTATPPQVRSAPPTLGQHTDELLAELGVDADRVAALRESGTVA